MFVTVKTIDGLNSHIITLSKAASVRDFRILVSEKFSVELASIRLYFRGKQLVDSQNVVDYDINLNDVVQLFISSHSTIEHDKASQETKEYSTEKVEDNRLTKTINLNDNEETLTHLDSSVYFLNGDKVDAIDPTLGAWFEATITKIVQKAPSRDGQRASSNNNKDMVKDDLTYYTTFDGVEADSLPQTIHTIRPRAKEIIPLDEINVGDKVFVNYNLEFPQNRGYWYDFIVKSITIKRSKQVVIGDVLVGVNQVPIENCTLSFPKEIMKIEELVELSNRKKDSTQENSRLREIAPQCSNCHDRGSLCKYCGCNICHSKSETDCQIVCDECQYIFHIHCLDPPLDGIPEGDWYCPKCKRDDSAVIKPGEEFKSKRKSKLVSKTSGCTRDWGRGMACVGRQTVCTLVPTDHIGPIPGVEVGTAWKFRVQVSEAGVHRPHVAGIHGTESKGAFSIVFSGGYEGDVDNGDEFFYTGAGGRDLSGNKRTASQSCDQVLTRTNKALAKSCNAPLNADKGATSNKWKKGQAIRVVRNYKAIKHSRFAPTDGNRYDGIYKVVKYWPEKGPSGFIVWRFLFRRDDPSPAPWTTAGQKRIKELGLEMIYPDGYLEAMEQKDTKVSRKRSTSESDEDKVTSPGKRLKGYKLDSKVIDLIKCDDINSKLWDSCLENLGDGHQSFKTSVLTTFMCICCQELVVDPVTTTCKHNICKDCLKRSFDAKVYSCPTCRENIKDMTLNINKSLDKVLVKLFQGYKEARK